MQKFQDVILDQYGNVVQNASITVYNTGTAVKPTIYSDNGITITTNPVTTDSLGRYYFYAPAGRYDLAISGSKIVSYTETDVLLQDSTADLANTSTTTLGDYLVGVQRTATGTTATNLHNWIEGQVLNLKTDFDAVGDGVADDTVPINKWLAVGGRLYAPPGIYKYTSALTPASNSEIFGGGDSTLFQGAANCKGFSLVGLSNVYVHDIKIDGAKSTYTTTTNDGLKIDWTSVAGSNIRLSHVTINNVAGAGIIALASSGTASSRLSIENCNVTNTGAHGIIAQDYISSVTIRRNYVEATALLVNDRPGITASRNGSFVVVDDNICVGSSSSGGTSVHGISLDTTNNFTCKGNIVSGWTKGFGIEVGICTNGAVNGNTVTGCNGDIVLSGVEASSSFNQNITVSGNTSNASTGASGAIYSFITGATGAVMHKNIVIAGNTVQGCTAGAGIKMSFCDKLTISGNSIFNNFLSGIYVLDCTNHFIDGNAVVNNNCASIKTGGGLTLSGSTVTATFTGHGYSTSDVVAIWGANPSEYNGSFTITVTGPDTFTYTAVSGLLTPAVGSINCSKANSVSHAGVRVQYSAVSTKNTWASGSNYVFGNGFREWYDISVNSVVGLFNDMLFLKETRQSRVENLTSGEASNIRDRVAAFMKNDKIVFAYNNAGTINYLSCALDGSTVTWVNSSTLP